MIINLLSVPKVRSAYILTYGTLIAGEVFRIDMKIDDGGFDLSDTLINSVTGLFMAVDEVRLITTEIVQYYNNATTYADCHFGFQLN